jgi:transposase-like protein
MINWELPHENVACPHCGSTETQVSLQLLGLVRYTCDGCKKSFAMKNAANAGKSAVTVDQKSSVPAR